MGLGVAPEALAGVLVGTGRAHIGAGAAIGEAATAIGAGTERVGVACHVDLLRSGLRGAPFALPCLHLNIRKQFWN